MANKNRRKIKNSVNNSNISNNENINENVNNKKEVEIKKEYKNIKEFFKDYIMFFKTMVLKKQIIFFIIILIIFGFFVITYVTNLGNEDFLSQLQQIKGEYVKPNAFSVFVKEKLPDAIIIILSGIAPYIYAPILGVLYGYQVAINMISIISVPNASYNLIFMLVGALIEFIGFSLAIATGFTFCSYSTKRVKYANKSEPTFLDFRKEIYSLTDNKKKLKQLEIKKKEKAKKIEKYNVKTPYIFIFTSFIISVIIILIGTFIFYV